MVMKLISRWDKVSQFQESLPIFFKKVKILEKYTVNIRSFLQKKKFIRRSKYKIHTQCFNIPVALLQTVGYYTFFFTIQWHVESLEFLVCVCESSSQSKRSRRRNTVIHELDKQGLEALRTSD
uniref:Uncharacterized protein n=1 Tax=Micrurus spixii TaxID=129469 RepID=A0A2D4MZL0_9SAUR